MDRNSLAAGLLWWPGQHRLAANFAGFSRCSILEIFGLLLKPFQGLWEQVIPVLDPLPRKPTTRVSFLCKCFLTDAL